MNRAVSVVAGLVLAVGMGSGADSWAADEPAPATPDSASIQDNMDVGLEYTLTVDGQVVDSTEGKDPFHYIHGKQQVIPGLEKQIAGMKIGESKDVTISPAEGYGELDPSAVVELPKAQLPTDITPEVGMILRGVTPEGQGFQATVKELKGENVILDLNHPLAGKTLNFKVKVVGIAPVPAQ